MRRNLFYACGAQIVSFLLSILLSLILPKCLGLEDYAYWQLFIFYASYTGIFHFGLTDGLYLRLGGRQYHQLNFSEIKAQMFTMVLIQLFIGCMIAVFVQFTSYSIQRKEILYFTIYYMIVGNISWFFGYLFQAVNLIDKYARAVIINKVIVIVSFMVLIFQHKTSCFDYVKWYCASQTTMCLYSLLCVKEILCAKLCSLRCLRKELKINVSCGSILTLSNISGNLIIGATRQIIDLKWGLVTFGKISMAFSLTMFFQQFINQIGNVFFPVLRRKQQDSIQDFYTNITILFSIILPMIFVFYIPLTYVMQIWLSQYGESLKYMLVLLPVCVFEGKMSVLCTTVLKVYRKEKKLLIINVVSMILSVSSVFIITAILSNIWITMSITVFIIIAREIYAENYVRKLLKLDTRKWQVHECILVGLMELTLILGVAYKTKFVLCVLEYMFFIYIHREEIKRAISLI